MNRVVNEKLDQLRAKLEADVTSSEYEKMPTPAKPKASKPQDIKATGAKSATPGKPKGGLPIGSGAEKKEDREDSTSYSNDFRRLTGLLRNRMDGTDEE